MTIKYKALLALSIVVQAVAQKSPLQIPLYYWQAGRFENFGDFLSLKLLQRIVNGKINICNDRGIAKQKKLLAVGSILTKARNHDVIWGSGIKRVTRKDYHFSQLDVRAVRGPLTRKFLLSLGIACPEIYGDPVLLFPHFFPEFKKSDNPRDEYLIIPHYSEEKYFPKTAYPNAVYPSDNWEYIIKRVLDSRFVISSSLHGIIIAEAYGIPARMLRITNNQPLLKYQDYYYGTNRYEFSYATSVAQALKMGPEKPFECELQKLYDAFPRDYIKGKVHERVL